MRAGLIWAVLASVVVTALAAAASSPLLAWREPVYIIAGFAGIIGLALMLFQPLLAGGYLPGISLRHGRRAHVWTGAALVGAILVHVVGLWITSPPDVIDALSFASPTPFSIWGVFAMWAIFAAALLAAFRRKIRPRLWRRAHTILVVVAVLGTALHAVLIDGTMETVSKVALCLLVLAATTKAVLGLRVFAFLSRAKP